MAKSPKNAINGWINLSKPLGITSADAVNKAKWLMKPTKIGHAGTLDPLATGVLPLALGEGTKCVNLLMDAKKTYEFAVTFGQRRTTDDAEGEVVATCDHIPTTEQILSIIPAFTGTVMQMPPIFSALKVAGKRAYDLARAGEKVVLQARPVTIYALEFLGFTGMQLSPSSPLEGERDEARFLENSSIIGSGYLQHPTPHRIASRGDSTPPQGGSWEQAAPSVAHFRAVVSKGTYIRSLGRDIAQGCGSEGYISRLHRAAVGPFVHANAISLDFLTKSVHKAPPLGEITSWLTPLERALDDIPALAIDGGQLNQLRHGQQVTLAAHHPDTPQLAVLHQGKLVGLARVEGNQVISNRLLNVNPMS